MIFPVLRVARATSDLKGISEMYLKGLGLHKLGKFENHSGYDGIMIGSPHCPYHFEFTFEQGHLAPRSNSEENLIIFYIPSAVDFNKRCEEMLSAGFQIVPARNPYWDIEGKTFEDFEGYRVVITQRGWAK